MTPAPRGRAAFSLVEVIIAVGVVTVAVVAMVALSSSLLGNARETAAQNEALQFVPSINDFLQRTVQQTGFSTVYGWAQAPSGQPLIFAYSVETNDQTRIVVTNVVSALTIAADSRSRKGRLFSAALSFSTNNPAGLTNLPAAMTDYTNFALPLRVELKNVADVTVTPSSNSLVFSYETAVFR